MYVTGNWGNQVFPEINPRVIIERTIIERLIIDVFY